MLGFMVDGSPAVNPNFTESVNLYTCVPESVSYEFSNRLIDRIINLSIISIMTIERPLMIVCQVPVMRDNCNCLVFFIWFAVHFRLFA